MCGIDVEITTATPTQNIIQLSGSVLISMCGIGVEITTPTPAQKITQLSGFVCNVAFWFFTHINVWHWS